MTLLLQIALLTALVSAILLPIVGKHEEWKKEMDEDERNERD
jgi:hypothetical protein